MLSQIQTMGEPRVCTAEPYPKSGRMNGVGRGRAGHQRGADVIANTTMRESNGQC